MTAPVLALAGQGGAILAVEDSYVGGIGSELAEAAAAQRRLARWCARWRSAAFPKSGRTPDDVLAYVHLALNDIIEAASALAGQQPARGELRAASHGD